MLNTVTEINEMAKNPEMLIKISEKEYVKNIYKVAETIADNDDIKIVSLAGPSGSGKTTTAHILQERLNLFGEKTAVVSLDDFYLPEDRLPVLGDGKLDIESVNSLDLQLIEKCFNEIIVSGKTYLPRYDFEKRSSF